MPFDREQLLARVAERSGFPNDPELAERCGAVVQVLGECLGHADAERLAEELPEPFASRLRGAEHGPCLEEPQFVARVRDLIQLRASVAFELTRVVLSAVAERVRPEALSRLQRLATDSLAALLVPPAQLPEAPPHVSGLGRTLADGRPGGGRPLYLARPDRTHSDSVASENPHGETKLSSAKGLSQEREERTLALHRK